jgi:hypothetical protein
VLTESEKNAVVARKIGLSMPEAYVKRQTSNVARARSIWGYGRPCATPVPLLCHICALCGWARCDASPPFHVMVVWLTARYVADPSHVARDLAKGQGLTPLSPSARGGAANAAQTSRFSESTQAEVRAKYLDKQTPGSTGWGS